MKQIIRTEKAPKAVGPYSQGIRVGNLVFTAGQLGLDPATGKLVEGGIKAQTRQALTNVKAVLEAAGASLDNVVKVTVFMANMDEFADMNGVYTEFFAANPPGRSAVQVARLPLGGQVEIEAVAVVE